jgi:hypothetical protein
MQDQSGQQCDPKGQKRILMLYSYLDNALPLPDPFPDYLTCPHCGEHEVEIWCYEPRARCHRCGGWIEHTIEIACRIFPVCQAGKEFGENYSV